MADIFHRIVSVGVQNRYIGHIGQYLGLWCRYSPSTSIWSQTLPTKIQC